MTAEFTPHALRCILAEQHPTDPLHAGTLESLSPSHTLRAVIHEIRAAERPPGEHITFPEVAWPEAVAEPPDTTPTRVPMDRRSAWDAVPPMPMPIGMIEPRSSLAPAVFWVIVVAAFACVLAQSAGWL